MLVFITLYLGGVEGWEEADKGKERDRIVGTHLWLKLCLSALPELKGMEAP